MEEIIGHQIGTRRTRISNYPVNEANFDSKLSGEVMASKLLKKINAKLKFLYLQSRYLTPAYKRLLCNALIQPHFDYGCPSWFSL